MQIIGTHSEEAAMPRLRNTINRAKTIAEQYCTRSIGIKAVAIATCTVAGLNANPALTTTFNAVAWLVVEAINEQSDRP
ncbi:MAG: hypothetical protein AAGA60_27585 [Cyanobacteria bacterium P01_E01_bin.42]